MSTRREFLKQLGIGAALLTIPACAISALKKNGFSSRPASAQRPNIILIMADDMGFSDIGCYGSEITTPNLDRLAKNGLKYTQFYNGARCCPTRAALITGLYAHQAGMGGMEPDWLEPGYRGGINAESVTLAEALKENGYSTYMCGKWHLTNLSHAKKEEDKFDWPCQRGFDKFFGTISGGGSYFKPGTLTRDNTDITEGHNQDFYYTNQISKNAAMYINQHCKNSKDQPFFEYVTYTAPHWPLHALPEDIKKYKGLYDGGWDKLRIQRHKNLKKLGLIDKNWKLPERTEYVLAWDDVGKIEFPKHMAAIPGVTKENLKKYMSLKMEIYAAQIDCMDQGIGKIVKTLKDNGVYDNTLIIFLADNGGCAEYSNYGFGTNQGNTFEKIGGRDSHASYGAGWANASNSPFRYFKHYIHEGGISTPLIVSWPNGIKDKGGVRNQIGHIIDFMPTVIELADGKYPLEYKGKAIKPMEGQSLVDTFYSQKGQRQKPLFWEHHGNRAMRDGKWKLVAKGETASWELYDMLNDRTETNDLATKYPEIVKKMDQCWWLWAKRCDVLPMNPHKKDRAYSKARAKAKADAQARKAAREKSKNKKD